MKAAVYYETGAPDVLRYEDVPDPTLGPGGVLVRVAAISIEGGDTLNRLGGEMPAVPHLVGYQWARTTVAAGEGGGGGASDGRRASMSAAGDHSRLPAMSRRWRAPHSSVADRGRRAAPHPADRRRPPGPTERDGHGLRRHRPRKVRRGVRAGTGERTQITSASARGSMSNVAKPPSSIAVLTSGGDAQGMNPAVRAVVRTALHHGVDVYAIYEGYRGLVEGGSAIRQLESADVGGILHRGGTVIGTARSQEFRTRQGRLRAARNLLEHSIDALVVIGGDGSLTGANLFREEWPDLLAELVRTGEMDGITTSAHPFLRLVGLVGSIDNDMFGTDMTIGADSALHRITEALDALHSTAASHQRAFVVEVMGRHCGYLALMASLATGANWVFIPERPPEHDDWGDVMCATLRAGRDIGRRQNVVIVAEGARDRHGNPIDAPEIKRILEEQLGEDTRITTLGHVQRGGAPSAFDRYQSTLLGHAAVEQIHFEGMHYRTDIALEAIELEDL